MFKRVYPVVLGVYTVLLVSKAASVALNDVNGFLSLGLGRIVLVVAHDMSASVKSFFSILF